MNAPRTAASNSPRAGSARTPASARRKIWLEHQRRREREGDLQARVQDQADRRGRTGCASPAGRRRRSRPRCRRWRPPRGRRRSRITDSESIAGWSACDEPVGDERRAEPRPPASRPIANGSGQRGASCGRSSASPCRPGAARRGGTARTAPAGVPRRSPRTSSRAPRRRVQPVREGRDRHRRDRQQHQHHDRARPLGAELLGAVLEPADARTRCRGPAAGWPRIEPTRAARTTFTRPGLEGEDADEQLGQVAQRRLEDARRPGPKWPPRLSVASPTSPASPARVAAATTNRTVSERRRTGGRRQHDPGDREADHHQRRATEHGGDPGRRLGGLVGHRPNLAAAAAPCQPRDQPLIAPLSPPPRRNSRWKTRKSAIGMMLEIVSAAMKTPRSVVGWSVGSRTDSGWRSGFADDEQRPQVVLPGRDHREHRHDAEDRPRHRQDDRPEQPERSGAVDPGRLEDLARQVVEEPLHQDDVERARAGRQPDRPVRCRSSASGRSARRRPSGRAARAARSAARTASRCTRPVRRRAEPRPQHATARSRRSSRRRSGRPTTRTRSRPCCSR